MILLMAGVVVGCNPVGTLAPMPTAAETSGIPVGAKEEKGTAFPTGMHVIISGCETSMYLSYFIFFLY